MCTRSGLCISSLCPTISALMVICRCGHVLIIHTVTSVRKVKPFRICRTMPPSLPSLQRPRSEHICCQTYTLAAMVQERADLFVSNTLTCTCVGSQGFEEAPPSWDCPKCTFINVLPNETCDMCGEPRPPVSVSLMIFEGVSCRMINKPPRSQKLVRTLILPLHNPRTTCMVSIAPAYVVLRRPCSSCRRGLLWRRRKSLVFGLNV